MYKNQHVVKDPADQNGTARMDSAIGQLKRATRRMEEVKGGSWLDHLQKVAAAYNKTPHGAARDPPGDMSDSTIPDQRELATVDTGHNMKQMKQREEELRKEGAFRTLKGKKRGLRRRIDESTWSKRIHLVEDFPAPGMVRDEEGKLFATSRPSKSNPYRQTRQRKRQRQALSMIHYANLRKNCEL